MKRTFSIITVVFLTIASWASAQAPIFASGNLLVTGNYNRGLGSSDQVFVVQLEANGEILVDEGHAVKYFQNKTANNLAGVTDWMMPGYDDSGWTDGVSSVGYNSSQTTEVVDDDDMGAIWSRYAAFDAPAGASQLTIRMDYDDGGIVWLNGVEILRVNMPVDDVPEWDYPDVTSHESTNMPGPDPSRWNATVSNLFGLSDDNPDGTIVDTTIDVVFDSATSVEPAGKLAMTWASMKAVR